MCLSVNALKHHPFADVSKGGRAGEERTRAGVCSCIHGACPMVPSANTHDGLPRSGAEESLCTAVGNGISQKHSCGPLVISVSAGEWTKRGEEIYEGLVHD